jgi:glc operon protein GlcG
MRNTLFALLLMLAVSARLSAQVVERKTLSLDGARQVIAAAQAEAKRLNAPGGVVAVVDDGGNLIALERLDGTFAAGANISIGKARTAVQFKKPTKFFEDIIRNGRTPMIALNDFTPLQGGVPIIFDGQMVGGIAGANAFAPKAASAPVRFFPDSEVESAFAKGAVLFDGNGSNYMIHASRREKPGMAEVHTKDADIIHVLDGAATLVTGGSVVASRSVADDEFRGDAIDGGEPHLLAKGDVIVVPAGVPHWFKQVNGPFLYYVVKVR